MTIRACILRLALPLGLLLMAGCERKTGPIVVSAIGGQPAAANPNLTSLDPPSAFLAEATAQGLVRFDAGGQVEPALAQSWIVSDDGLRYTFRLAPSTWSTGGKVTAEQVAARLRAAASAASRNPLKPVLGAVAGVAAMTDNVLEIGLRAPRPNFLQLLAQPEMAVMRGTSGTGPYRPQAQGGGALLLVPPAADEDEDQVARPPAVLLRGERAARAVARFAGGSADLVTGGTLGDLAVARAADPGSALRFDPVAGLLGFVFTRTGGEWAQATAREALSMAIDRDNLVDVLDVPGLQARTAIVPPGIDELPAPAVSGWTTTDLGARRAEARRRIGAAEGAASPVLRVALPEGPGYRLLFAVLRRDWRLIGVDAKRVGPRDVADLRLVDAIAPAALSTWYLRMFTCDANPICDAQADRELAVARTAPNAAERQVHLAAADRLIEAAVPFVPLTAPVRWSLVGPRVRGFQPNVFGRRFAGSLTGPQ